MNMHPTTPRPRSRFGRFAIALAAMAHLLAAFVAPMTDAGGERGLGVHVEEAGTSKHHSHVDSTCVVCAAHTLAVNPGTEVFRLSVASMRSRVPVSSALLPATASLGPPVGSRAPPNIA
jgi:hypothetical protein